MCSYAPSSLTHPPPLALNFFLLPLLHWCLVLGFEKDILYLTLLQNCWLFEGVTCYQIFWNTGEISTVYYICEGINFCQRGTSHTLHRETKKWKTAKFLLQKKFQWERNQNWNRLDKNYFKFSQLSVNYLCKESLI